LQARAHRRPHWIYAADSAILSGSCVPMVDRPAKCRQIPRLKNIPLRDQAMLARFPEIPDRYRRLSSFDLSKRLVALGERNSSDFTFRSVGAACSLWDQSPSCSSPFWHPFADDDTTALPRAKLLTISICRLLRGWCHLEGRL
jgi:hypothetical protein